MRHFAFLTPADAALQFERPPEPFDAASDREALGVALGAVLYMPGTRLTIADDLVSGRWPALTSVCICLEDAIGDADLEAAQANVVAQVRRLDAAVAAGTIRHADVPLVFVRVRNPEHVTALERAFGRLPEALAGFVLPKFGPDNGRAYLDRVAAVRTRPGRRLWALPILEGHQIIQRETRLDALLEVARLLADHRPLVPCVRVGATDLSGLYGLRRSPDLTVYDIGVVRDCISDIVNVLGRPEHGLALSGPAWEYFHTDARMFKPLLRETPFADSAGDDGRRMRTRMVGAALDGLVREVLLDQANGLQGKTIIHPSHIVPVNALLAVSAEEDEDARAILGRSLLGGVAASAWQNKMNEIKPHLQWAERVLARARAFGVLRRDGSWVALMEAAGAHDRRAGRPPLRSTG